MLDNIYWCVGNGNDISVWNDSWIVPGFKLKDPVQSIPSELSPIRVAELVDDHGHWNLAPIEHLIPQVIRHRIRAIIPPNIDNGIDLKLWPENSHGDFTLASSTPFSQGMVLIVMKIYGRRSGKCEVLERVRSFLWLMTHERLLTKERKHRMGLGDDLCNHCYIESETACACRS